MNLKSIADPLGKKASSLRIITSCRQVAICCLGRDIAYPYLDAFAQLPRRPPISAFICRFMTRGFVRATKLGEDEAKGAVAADH